MKIQNPFRRMIEAGDPVLGIWQQLSHPAVAELMAYAGYDVVLIDMEHGPGTLAQTADMLRGVSGTGAASMVRIPANDPVMLKALLDQGPDGVMIPMVQNAEEARAAVAACRYPTEGRRGWAAGVARGARYGFDPDYTLSTARQLVIACQIESVVAAEHADEIAATDGVDIIFVGRNDLAADAGHLLDLDHPDVDRLVTIALSAAKRHGKWAGTVPSTKRSWQALFDDGFDFVLPSGDISMLRDAATAEIAEYRAYRGRPKLVSGAGE